MEKEGVPLRSTGGAGFGLEDELGVHAALLMLVGDPWFGDDEGRLAKVTFQARNLGWQFDDLVVAEGLEYLFNKADGLPSRDRSARRVFTTLFNYAATIWERFADDVLKSPSYRANFLHLIEALAGSGDASAIQLQSRVEQTLRNAN